VELEVISWLSRCTLDIIGLAGFGYTFDALASDGKPNELLSAFRALFEPDAVRSVLNMVIPGFRHLVRALRLPDRPVPHTCTANGAQPPDEACTERDDAHRNPAPY
jgi:hypothetical protein